MAKKTKSDPTKLKGVTKKSDFKFTQNPNDPAYRAYRDSLNLYNKTMPFREYAERAAKEYDFITNYTPEELQAQIDRGKPVTHDINKKVGGRSAPFTVGEQLQQLGDKFPHKEGILPEYYSALEGSKSIDVDFPIYKRPTSPVRYIPPARAGVGQQVPIDRGQQDQITRNITPQRFEDLNAAAGRQEVNFNYSDVSGGSYNKPYIRYDDPVTGERKQVAAEGKLFQQLQRQGQTFQDGGQLMLPQYRDGGGIYIKPSKRGSLRKHLGVSKGKNIPASKLAIKSTDSPAIRKKKQFAINARKWQKEFGGYLDQQLDAPIIEETPIGSGMTPVNQFGCGGKLRVHAEGGPLDALKYLNNSQPQGIFGQIAKGVGGSVGGLIGGIGGLKGKQTLKEIAKEEVTGELGEEDIGVEEWMTTPFEATELPEQGEGLYNEFGGYLPEFGFGSWLGDNAGGILQGAGDAVSAIPVIGTIAGPILNMAGKVTDALVSKKRAGEAEKALAIKERVEATKEGFEQQLGAANQPQYEAVAQFGGNLMDQGKGFPSPNQNPVIVGYNGNSNTHQQGVGGVPVDSKGNPSTVSRQSAVGLTESGEVTWNGYVFSDKLKV